MFSYIWPIALLVLANTVYQICAKSVPEGMNAFASLTITYLVGAVTCIVLYFLFNSGENLIKEYPRRRQDPVPNRAPFRGGDILGKALFLLTRACGISIL